MKINGAIFDMDGTLVDSLFFWENEWKKIGGRFLNNPDFQASEELDTKIRTTTLNEGVQVVIDELKINETYETVYEFFHGSLFDFYRNESSLKAGVTKTLEIFKENNIKMCVASATDGETVKKVLQMFDIDKYFEAVISCCDDDVQEGKYSPKIYEKALKILNTKNEETVVFEDSFTALETAKNMGVATVGVFDKNNYGQDRLKNASTIYYADKTHSMFDAAKLIIKNNR